MDESNNTLLMVERKTRLLIHGFGSCAQLLYREFDILKLGYYFYEKGKIDPNFDAILKFDHKSPSDFKFICDLYNIPIIGMRRYWKMEQNMMLTNAGIMCPDTYDCSVKKDLEILDTLLHDVSDKTDIILKPQLGAKGIGQVKIKRGELYDKLYKLWKLDSKETKEAKEGNDNNKDDPDYLSEEIKKGGYCIQIFDRKIEEEYRILYFFENKPIIMKRLKGDSTWQSNNGAKPDNDSEYIGNNIQDLFGVKNAKIIDEFFHNLNTPFLSIDVYKNREGEMGIMEFQMEFGYKNCPINVLYEYMNSSVNRMLIRGNYKKSLIN